MAEEVEKTILTPLEKANKRIKALEDKLHSLGVKGDAKLFYSINKNMADLSEMLDKIEMRDIDLNDPKDKTMERLKIIWSAITPLSETLKSLKSSAGITGDENEDVIRKPFVNTIAQSRS